MSFRQRNPDQTTFDLSRIERVVARDPAALGELYDEHSRLLFGLILRILKDRGEAEEVLQEVFVQAWTRASTYNLQLGSPGGSSASLAIARSIACEPTPCAFALSTPFRNRRRSRRPS